MLGGYIAYQVCASALIFPFAAQLLRSEPPISARPYLVRYIGLSGHISIIAQKFLLCNRALITRRWIARFSRCFRRPRIAVQRRTNNRGRVSIVWPHRNQLVAYPVCNPRRLRRLRIRGLPHRRTLRHSQANTISIRVPARRGWRSAFADVLFNGWRRVRRM